MTLLRKSLFCEIIRGLLDQSRIVRFWKDSGKHPDHYRMPEVWDRRSENGEQSHSEIRWDWSLDISIQGVLQVLLCTEKRRRPGKGVHSSENPQNGRNLCLCQCSGIWIWMNPCSVVGQDTASMDWEEDSASSESERRNSHLNGYLWTGLYL